MNIKELLQEKHYSGPLYHITSRIAIKDMLSKKRLKFGKLKDSNEQKISKMSGGFNYFFSTSRSVKNHYMMSLLRDPEMNDHGVIISLNAEYFIHNGFKMSPVSYYGVEFLGHEDEDTLPDDFYYKRKEGEERIFGKERINSIDPSKAFSEIHILNKSKISELGVLNIYIIPIEKLCQSYDIPLFIYNNLNDWQLLNKNKAFRSLNDL